VHIFVSSIECWELGPHPSFRVVKNNEVIQFHNGDMLCPTVKG